ncbi:MAG: hypothetical protein GF307_02420 [candidate division Zixibacteria bacterium]|nr:hypothetical protein [candidate division Zixibacteria bacterium]
MDRTGIAVLIYLFLILPSLVYSQTTITLDRAINTALHRTDRGEMIKANLEVAEQNYFARRINFYLPEISIKGSVPAYSVDESYRFFGGSTQKQLYKTRDLGVNTFIELKQALLTGGDVVITANLLASEDRYPNTRTTTEDFIEEITRRGYFTFRFTQPILKPSESKNNLRETGIEYDIAKIARIEEEIALEKEVIEEYIGVLQLTAKTRMQEDKYEAAVIQAAVDSVKQRDGVISEEEWLISASERLDAELSLFDIQTDLSEKKRALAILLDRDVDEELHLIEPTVEEHLTEQQKGAYSNSWNESLPIKKADLEYKRAKRQADYQASGHGLTGDLTADYSTGQGEVKTDGVVEDINTRGWGISLNLSYPIWDGGSSSAALKAARIQAEQAKLEYNRAKQQARAEIVDLLNNLDVSYRRLDIMRQQIELAYQRVRIAEGRFSDGQISKRELLETKVTHLEARDKYLEELKTYLTSKVDLEGKFAHLDN